MFVIDPLSLTQINSKITIEMNLPHEPHDPCPTSPNHFKIASPYLSNSNNQFDREHWYPAVHGGGFITAKLAFMVRVVVLLGWL